MVPFISRSLFAFWPVPLYYIRFFFPSLISFVDFLCMNNSFFTLGSSTMYIGIGIPVSCLSGIKYPGMFFLPILILAISASISFFHASSWLDFYFRKRPVISATTFGVRINYFIWTHFYYQRKQKACFKALTFVRVK